jgi:hypothetical protein
MLALIALSLALAQAPEGEGAAPPAAPAESTPPPAAPSPYPPAPAPAAPTPGSDAPVAGPSPLAAYVPGEGFRIKDDSGDYTLRIGLQSAYKFEPTWNNGVSQERQAIAFLRPILRGNLFKPWITFWTSLEMSGNPIYVLDSYFDVVPVEQFGTRIGQQYSLIDRQEQLGPQQLFFPEWAPAPEYFWPGRDKGVQVYGFLWDKKFEYYAGAFSGTPLRQTSTIPGNYQAEGRVVYSPWGPANDTEFPFTSKGESLPTRLSFSVQGYQGTVQLAAENFNEDNGKFDAVPTGMHERYIYGEGDVWFQTGPLILTAAGYWRRVNLLDGSPLFNQAAAYGEAIVDLWAHKLGLGAQMNWIDPNTSISNDSALAFQVCFDWFIHAPELVLKLRYGHIYQENPNNPAASLPYATGNTDLVTLQFNLSF